MSEDPEIERRLAGVRRYAWLLDGSIKIPFTQRTIGLEGLIGLIPVVGDAAGLVLSSVVVAIAARMGAPAWVLLQMGLNIGVDALIGVVPIVGDVFDLVWKANQRNVALLERCLESPQETTRSSRIAVAGVAVAVTAGIGGLLVASVWATIALLKWLI